MEFEVIALSNRWSKSSAATVRPRCCANSAITFDTASGRNAYREDW